MMAALEPPSDQHFPLTTADARHDSDGSIVVRTVRSASVVGDAVDGATPDGANLIFYIRNSRTQSLTSFDTDFGCSLFALPDDAATYDLAEVRACACSPRPPLAATDRVPAPVRR